MEKDRGSASIWPVVCRVNEKRTFKVTYTVGERIPKGGGIFVWPPWAGSYPQVESPDSDAYVYVRTSAAVKLQPVIMEKGHWYYSTTEGDRQVRMFVAVFVEVIYGELKPGNVVELVFSNMRAQYAFEQNKLWVARALPQGKAMHLWDRNGAAVAYLPGEPARLRLFAPSALARGEEFSLLVGVFDEFDNPVLEPFGSKVRLTSNVEVEGLPAEVDFSKRSWNQTRLRGLRCVEPGACYISGEAEGIAGRSNPIFVTEGPPKHRIFWGDLHIHTEISDGIGPPEEVYQMARDVYGLDFAALCDHEAAREDWERTKRASALFDSPGRFVTIPAWEWTSHAHGHRNVYFLSEENSIPSFGHGEGFSLRDLYKALKNCGGPAMVIPHHPIWFMDFSTHDPELERVVEIYSIWGSSEFQDNELQFLAKEQPNEALRCDTVRGALARGHRLGFVGSSDCHITRGGQPYPEYKKRGPVTPDIDEHFITYGAGLTAARAPQLERPAIWEAIRSRNCYATTGPRIYVDFEINDTRTGSEMKNRGEIGISLRATGTAKIVRAEIVKNGEVLHREEPDEETVTLCMSDCSDGSSYYYAKIVQDDGNMAWASPVWVGQG